MQNILITEGNFDVTVMQRVLPASISTTTKVVNGGGSTSALSAARSRYVDGNYKIVLLIDADSSDPSTINEKQHLYENMIYSLGTPSSEAKVVLLTPEIEALFFESKEFIEKTFGRSLSDLEFEFLKKNPKAAIERLAQGTQELPKQYLPLGNFLLEQLDDVTIERIRQSKQIQEIIEYFN
ncbi:MAG: hypothetical protein AB8E82_14860 [Aureispira sp.]